MISHIYQCIFVHVPKTAGKTVLGAFGLPEFGRDYHDRTESIEDPYDHVPLHAYRNRPFYDRYFKFCFVRNPWDRLVSAFTYLNAGGSNEHDAAYRDRHLGCFRGDFSLFVQALPTLIDHKHFRPQVRWLTAEYRGQSIGDFGMDFIGRFENLDSDMAHVSERLGLPQAALGHRNPSGRGSYRDYYDALTTRRVADVDGDNIRAFGYEQASPIG